MILYSAIAILSVLLAFAADLPGRAAEAVHPGSYYAKRVSGGRFETYVLPSDGHGFSSARAISLRRGNRVASLAYGSLYLLLVLPAALRQFTGNDYMRYVEIFHLVDAGQRVPTEAGFNLFVKAVYDLCGYENYLLVFGLFAAATTALFLGALRRQAAEFGFSFFLFMMFGYYFQSYNTVRYYLALAAAFFALYFFMEKEYLPFLCIVLLAAAFHKSVLVVLVLYPAAAAKWRRWYAGAALALGVSLLAFQKFWLRILLRFYPLWDDTQDLAQATGFSPGNILRCAAVLALAAAVMALCGGEGTAAEKIRGGIELIRPEKTFVYLKCTVLALWIYVFGSFIPEVSRICYYLTIPQVLMIPELIRYLPEKHRKAARILTGVIAAGAVLSFVVFLRKAQDPRIRILPYRSFLFHDLPGTPSRSIE